MEDERRILTWRSTESNRNTNEISLYLAPTAGAKATLRSHEPGHDTAPWRSRGNLLEEIRCCRRMTRGVVDHGQTFCEMSCYVNGTGGG